jgi:hypothetical protein
MRRFVFAVALIALGAFVVPGKSQAEMVRYRYVPADGCGAMRQVAIGPNGAVGELYQGLGLRPPQPFPCTFRTTHMVTFRHTNGCNVTVPLALPEPCPRIETKSDRVVYTSADYVVEVRFFGDGTVDVVYNSGFLRPLPVP